MPRRESVADTRGDRLIALAVRLRSKQRIAFAP
jgi:hypothetical protein